MTEYVGNGESYFGNKTLVETWTIIEESGLRQLLINAYKKKSQHQSEGWTFKHSKPMQEHFSYSSTISTMFFIQIHSLVLYVLSKYITCDTPNPRVH